ncbi:MAG: hypothetical protein IPM64_05450 [Phycisphaerales bacterium]|nr:hypothetical protein [Phycisphaerales bacterium]
MTTDRKPQINFQVEKPLKLLYDEAGDSGMRASRLCAAGLLLMIENPAARRRAINRLREWEQKFADASAEQVRAFVSGVEAAMLRATRETKPARRVPRAKKAAAAG